VNIYSNSSVVQACDLGVQEIAAYLSKILLLATWLGQNLKDAQCGASWDQFERLGCPSFSHMRISL